MKLSKRQAAILRASDGSDARRMQVLPIVVLAKNMDSHAAAKKENSAQ